MLVVGIEPRDASAETRRWMLYSLWVGDPPDASRERVTQRVREPEPALQPTFPILWMLR
jgi:hypothetical protein